MQRRRFPEVPDWSFDADEVSAGVYRASGRDGGGRTVEACGLDPEALIEQCRAAAIKLMAETKRRSDFFGAAEARYESSEATRLKPLPNPEEISTQFTVDSAAQSHFTSASFFRRQEEENDLMSTGIMIGVGIALLVFFGSMIAVLMMHGPSL